MICCSYGSHSSFCSILLYTDGPNWPFGVNKDFEVLAQLYNDTDALFLANTGILSKQVTNEDDWNGEQRTQLFAHNSMVVSEVHWTLSVNPEMLYATSLSLILFAQLQ